MKPISKIKKEYAFKIVNKDGNVTGIIWVDIKAWGEDEKARRKIRDFINNIFLIK